MDVEDPDLEDPDLEDPDAEPQEAPIGPGFGLLQVLAALGSHTGESEEALLAMPWPRFCARWVLLIKFGYDERRRREWREAKAAREREMRELEHVHARRMGGR